MVTRRGFLSGIGVAAAASWLGMEGEARASMARAVTLKELVSKSRHVVVGMPVDAFSRWEMVGKRQRIVTYSLLQVDHALDGNPTATAEVMVRTLGGSVGDLGQIVHGEAELALGERSAVFLADLGPDLFRVTAMSQGHYPIRVDQAGVQRLRTGLASLEIIDVPAAAVHRLDGTTVVDAEAVLVEERFNGSR